MLKDYRNELPVVLSQTYFNTGVCGPLPRCTHQAMAEEMDIELCEGRARQGGIQGFKESLRQLRSAMAELLMAEPEEMAITQNTTDGVNIVVWGLDLQPGDQILTTTFEHLGGLAGLSTLCRQKGVDARFYNPPLGIFNLEDFLALITSKTRLMIISHVSWLSGLVIPVGEICRYARQKGIRVLIDGAQAVGAIPVDVKTIGTDFYAFSGQKWLLGPEGIGGLYIREDVISSLNQVFAGKFSFARHDGEAIFQPHEGAKRFEAGTRYRPSILGMKAGLAWLAQEVQWKRIHRQIQRGTTLLIEGLLDQTPLEPVSCKERAGLVTINLPAKWSAEEVVKILAAQKIIVRSLPGSNSIRASVGFFNNDEDIQQLIGFLKDLH